MVEAPVDKRSVGQKIWQFPIVRLLLGFAIVGLAASLGSGLIIGIGEIVFGDANFSGWFIVLRGAVPAGFALLAYYLYVRFVERRTATEIGLSGAVAETGLGILVGAGLFAVTIGTLWLLGNYKVVGYNGFSGIGQPLGAAISAGVVEEILFRALLFRLFEKWLGSWMSLGISALFFGFAHAGNPGATFFSSLAIALEAGILLAATYMYTKRLWLSIGLHFAWNFVQGGIFGVAVSGNVQQGILEGSLTGPELIAGGDFGAEASIFALLFCMSMAGYLLWQKRDHFMPAPWQESYTG